jgi:NADH-quinone oxidoreductase subunit M
MNSFVSEFLVLVGSFPRAPVYTVLATIGIIFAALYVLWFYQRVATGPVRGVAVVPTDGPSSGRPRFPDLSRRELVVLAPLVVLILGLGFYPRPVLDVITPSVSATMTEVGLTDPVTAQQGGK